MFADPRLGRALSRRKMLQCAAGAALTPSLLAATTDKIVRFHIHKATVRWRDLVFLEIETAAGLRGYGEATLETRADLVAEALGWLEDAMKGEPAGGAERHWSRNYYALSRWRNGAAEMSALSAVDIALWDLDAKRLGVPLYQLLGGAVHNPIPLYFTHWSAELSQRTPQAFAELAVKTRAAGWKAVKWTVPLDGPDRGRMARIAAEVESVRVAVGNDLEIGLELAETFNLRTLPELARTLAPYKPMFLEEPTLRENPELLGRLAANSPVPIATGEGLFHRYEFRQLLEAKGAAVVQPDVMHAGGITEIRKIAALAETFGAEIAPHMCSGPIGHVASLHAMAGCRNLFLQEWEAADDAAYRDLTNGTYPTQKAGVVTLPEAPGLGLTCDFAAFAKRFPYQPIRRRATLTK